MEWGLVFPLLLVGLPCLALGWCAWRFLARPRAEGFGGRFVQGLGLLALAALAASAVQLVATWAGWNWSGNSGLVPWKLVAILPVSWLVLCGGWSVQALFEETVEDVTGHRQSTMLDNWPYYATLTALQLAALAALVAWRGRRTRTRDPRAWVAAALVLANGIAGMAWPWWGT